MGRPSNTARRREEIVEALLAVIGRLGYEGATTAAVAEEAGLAPGLVHYHFASKLEILVALVEALSARIAARAAERLGRAGQDPLRRLQAFVDAHLALGPGADARAVAAWVAIAAEATRRPEVRRVYTAAIEARRDELARLFRECLRVRGSPVRAAAHHAAAVSAAIEGAFLLSVAAPGALPRGFAAPTVRRLIRSLI